MTEAESTPGKGDPEVVKLRIARRAMVRAMSEAVTVPTFYLRRTADVSGLVAERQRRREEGAAAPSVNDAVVRATALALREHPDVNASYVDGAVHRFPRVNVGVAVATDAALFVPAVYDADRREVASIGTEIRELAERARARRLDQDVLRDATFTVSNLGMFGIEEFDPIVNPPQAAILGVGAVLRRGDRDEMRLTLGCDHRVLTGSEGAGFLATLVELLAQPDRLFGTAR